MERACQRSHADTAQPPLYPVTLNHGGQVLGAPWPQVRHHTAVFLLDKHEKLAKGLQVWRSALELQALARFREHRLAAREVIPGCLDLRPGSLAQGLHHVGIKLVHGVRRPLSTDAGELPTWHNDVAEERATGAAEFAKNANRDAVIVRLRAETQTWTLEPGSIRLKQLSREIGRHRGAYERPRRTREKGAGSQRTHRS